MNYAQFEAAEREKHGGHIPTDFSGADPAIGTSEPIDNTASSYLERTGNHYLANKLDMTGYYKVDPLVETKIAEVDRYFQNAIEEFGMRDSALSFDLLLEQAIESLGVSLEELVRGGESSRILEHLFSNIALSNKKSSETYVKDAQTHYIENKIDQLERMIGELKEELISHRDTSLAPQPRHIWYPVGRKEAERSMRNANPKRKSTLNFI